MVKQDGFLPLILFKNIVTFNEMKNEALIEKGDVR